MPSHLSFLSHQLPPVNALHGNRKQEIAQFDNAYVHVQCVRVHMFERERERVCVRVHAHAHANKT